MELDEALTVFSALEREHVAYVLIGSMAMAVHGVVRATRDMDVFVEPSAPNVERLRRALHAVLRRPDHRRDHGRGSERGIPCRGVTVRVATPAMVVSDEARYRSAAGQCRCRSASLAFRFEGGVMPVRKFHSVEAMSTDHDKPAGVAAGDLRAAVRISLTCLALDGRRPPAGVYKYRSASEAWQTRRRWELALER